MPSRRVVIVAFGDFQILDVTGPAEVFAMAERFTPGSYSVTVVAPSAGQVRASNGLELAARSLRSAAGPIDTLVVAGGNGTPDAAADTRLIGWLTRTAPRCRRVTSVCSGAFLLARAGLLDGRRATTHWSATDTLARHFPAVTVEPDRIYVQDGPVWTSAGVTAGMDLALALVEEDLGRAAAREVARWLVLFLQRPGGQAQFSASLAAQMAEREPLRELQAWIVDNPAADLTVDALARRVSMSARNFARAFGRETGATPGDFVERARVEAARRLLESGPASVEAVARSCGFGTVETMQRTFRRVLGVSPSQYRNHFSKETA